MSKYRYNSSDKLDDYLNYYINTGIIPINHDDVLSNINTIDDIKNNIIYKSCCPTGGNNIIGNKVRTFTLSDGVQTFEDCNSSDSDYNTNCFQKTTNHECRMITNDDGTYNEDCQVQCLDTYESAYNRQLEQTINDKETIHRNQKQIINVYNKTINKNYNELEQLNDTINKSTTTIATNDNEFKKENMISQTLSIFIFMFIISTLIYILFYTLITERHVTNYVNSINNYK